MPSNVYEDQRNAFAQIKRVAEACSQNKTAFNVDMVLVETLSTYAISERAAKRFIERVRALYPDLKIEESEL